MNKIPRLNQFSEINAYIYQINRTTDIPETQHCFNDSTHHTCCEISKNKGTMLTVRKPCGKING